MIFNFNTIVIYGAAVAGFLFILVNFLTIRALYKAKNSEGYSKLAFWFIFIAVTYYAFYSFWLFGDMVLCISYGIQSMAIAVILRLLYKYVNSNKFAELELVVTEASSDTCIEITL